MQREHRVADPNGDRIAAWMSSGNDARSFAVTERAINRGCGFPPAFFRQKAIEFRRWQQGLLFRKHFAIRGSSSNMPIYEYACAACGTEFEKLVRQSSPAPECPGCHSTDLRKKLSAFASPGSLAGERELPAPCGSCGHPDGPGACRFQ
jgi:putative FmdB family regulatory protein